jgi:hypothetical protein
LLNEEDAMATTRYKVGDRFGNGKAGADGSYPFTATLLRYDAARDEWAFRWEHISEEIRVVAHGIDEAIADGSWTPLPSAQPAPVRKGRVGMRLKGHRSGREFTIANNVGGHLGDYWNTTSADGVEGVVCDDDIGTTWLIAPAATRAEAVQLRRDDLLPGDQFRYGDPDGNPACWEVVDSTHDRSIRGVKDYEVSDRLEWNVCNIVRAGTKGIRAAAPVATPEVVRAGVRLSHCRVGDVVHNARNEAGSASHIFEYGAATIMSIGAGRVDFALSGRPFYTEYAERYVVDVVSTAAPAPAPTALRRYEGAQQAEGAKYMRDADRREGSAAFTAAVTARLAARAEARRFATQREEPGTSDNEPADWEWNQ